MIDKSVWEYAIIFCSNIIEIFFTRNVDSMRAKRLWKKYTLKTEHKKNKIGVELCYVGDEEEEYKK